MILLNGNYGIIPNHSGHSYDIPMMIFLWYSYDIPMIFPHIPMIFLWYPPKKNGWACPRPLLPSPHPSNIPRSRPAEAITPRTHRAHPVWCWWENIGKSSLFDWGYNPCLENIKIRKHTAISMILLVLLHPSWIEQTCWWLQAIPVLFLPGGEVMIVGDSCKVKMKNSMSARIQLNEGLTGWPHWEDPLVDIAALHSTARLGCTTVAM